LRFWDSSALLPLLVEEPSSDRIRALLRADPQVVVWWGARVECTSALARLRREEIIDLDGEDVARALLGSFQDSWWEVQPSEEVRRRATRLLRLHPLKAADALQLGAALMSLGELGGEVVTFDERLARAARLEGLTILPG
jgi:predicted nucleic acid-binding protein